MTMMSSPRLSEVSRRSVRLLIHRRSRIRNSLGPHFHPPLSGLATERRPVQRIETGPPFMLLRNRKGRS